MEILLGVLIAVVAVLVIIVLVMARVIFDHEDDLRSLNTRVNFCLSTTCGDGLHEVK